MRRGAGLVQMQSVRHVAVDLREGKMGSRIARERRPGVEQFERRDLLSGITDVMAGNSIAANMREIASAATRSASNPSIALPQNQGPLLNPDGV